MAGLIVILGSIFGFATGLVAFFATDIGLFASLAIWAASGPLSLLFVTLLSGPSLLPDPHQSEAA